MFEDLSEKLEATFARLRGRGVLSEADIKEGLRKVRRVLLEADVNFQLTREFLERVEKKATGVNALSTVSPGQQLVKIVHEELAAMLGERREGMTGQDAVKIAQGFDKVLDITGVILTKMDGDARGGAALSIYGVTKKPIKYIGVGEKPDALEEFHPERMAGRILQMGDIVTLVEKAQASFDEAEAKRLEKKVRKEGMDLNDFLNSMRQIQKMGPLEGILKMLPGVNTKALKQMKADPKRMKHVEAIGLSMTPDERKNPGIINGSRR